MNASSETYRVGEARITRIAETVLDSHTLDTLLPAWNSPALAPARAALPPEAAAYLGPAVPLPVHTWVVQLDGRTILIDTGVGNQRIRATPGFDHLDTDYWDLLLAAGVQPDEVDIVVNTHMHTDHVGWNTTWRDGAWAPAFPNATYLIPSVELDRIRHATGPSAQLFADSIAPVLQAGLVREIAPAGESFLPGLAFHPTPGHTPGHMSITLQSEGEHALFGSDVMHTPLQVYLPTLSSCFCTDADLARASRLWALDHCVRHDARYFSSHFPGSSTGRLRATAKGYGWTFE